MKIISYWSMDWFSRENLNRKPWFLPIKDRAFRFQFSHHPILWIERTCESLSRPTFNCSSNKSARSSPKADALRYDGNVVGSTPRARGNPPFFIHFYEFSSYKPLFWMGNSNGQVSNNFVFPKHMSLPYESKGGVENEQHGGTTTNHQKPFHGYMATYCLSLCWIYTTKTYYMTNPLSVVIPLPSHTHTHIATNTKNRFIMKLP